MVGLALGLIVAGCRGSSDPTTTTTVSEPTTTVSTSTTTTEPPTTTTTEAGLAIGEQVPGTALWALVSGNDLEADRINLIFAPWGWDAYDNFEATAADMLSWDGNAYLISEAGAIVHDPLDAVEARLGVFGIEPWRSARNLFNVWITDVEPETPVAWLNEGEPPFDLPDQSVMILAWDADRFNPDLTSVAGLDVHFVGPGQPQRPLVGSPFANAMAVVPSTYPALGFRTVPHELGHALFNLPDEYVGEQLGFDGRENLSSWPSCAEDKAEADEWWGDLIGDVDPMLDIFLAELEEAGLPSQFPRTLWVESVEVSSVDGGCYGVDGSFRATFDSLMNNSPPILGSVNRRWAEEILDLWEGAPRS